MKYVLDGYNLLYALRPLGKQSSRAALISARRWLLQQIDAGSIDPATITVVFDGDSAEVKQTPSSRITLLFAASADDLVEEIIQAHKQPQQLTVVSNDNRLKRAAQKRGCLSLGCLDFWELMQAPPAASPRVISQDDSSKPEIVTPEEADDWEAIFGQGAPTYKM